MSIVTVIKPRHGWARLGFAELWQYRELLYFLAWRDVKVRYRQTAFGVAWAVLQPLLLMGVFTLFLGRLANMPSEGLPYPLFAFTALVPWTFFSQTVTGASNSLVAGANMVSKVYFPRLLLPISAAFSFLPDFLIALVLQFALMAYYGIAPGPRVLWLPLLLLALMLTAVGIGIGLSAINARYRDVRYAVPFLLQLWLFASPIAYPSSLPKGARTQMLLALNPLTGVLEGFRWALLKTGQPPGRLLLTSAISGLVILTLGLIYFQRVESSFADVI